MRDLPARSFAMCVLLHAISTVTSAQSPVRGENSITILVSSISGTPLGYATVAIRETGLERFANHSGEFFVGRMSPGVYHLRVRQLGYLAKDTAIELMPGTGNQRVHIQLTPIPLLLDSVIVTAGGNCPEPTDLSDPTNATLGVILGEIGKNADRLRLLQERYPFTYTLWREFLTFDPYLGTRSRVRDTVSYTSAVNWRYEPGEVVQRDSVTAAGQQVMRLPQLTDLADSVFQAAHCFFYRGTDRIDGTEQLRIEFIPLSSIDFPDVEGSVSIDAKSYVLTSARFRLTGGDKLTPPVSQIQVTTGYREIYPNILIFSDISASQPASDPRFLKSPVEVRQKQRLLSYRFLRGKPGDSIELVRADSAAKEKAQSDSVTLTLATISGSIQNSFGQLVAGAVLSISDSRFSSTTGLDGRFRARGIPPGTYDIDISAAGYESMKIRIDVTAGSTIELPLVLLAKPPE